MANESKNKALDKAKVKTVEGYHRNLSDVMKKHSFGPTFVNKPAKGHKKDEFKARSKKAGFYIHGHKNYGDVYEAMKGYKPGVTKKDIEAHKRTNEKVRRTDTMNTALEKAKGGKKQGEWGSKEHQYYHGSDSAGTYHVHYPNKKHRGDIEGCSMK